MSVGRQHTGTAHLKAGLRSMTEEGRGGLKVPSGRSLGCPARISSPLLIMGVVLAASLLELQNVGVKRTERNEAGTYLDVVWCCFGDTDFVPLLISVSWLSLGDLETNK